MSGAYKKSAKETFELFKKYQTTIHDEAISKITEERYARFLVRSPLRVHSIDYSYLQQKFYQKNVKVTLNILFLLNINLFLLIFFSLSIVFNSFIYFTCIK